jgi:hypothetical protein
MTGCWSVGQVQWWRHDVVALGLAIIGISSNKVIMVMPPWVDLQNLVSRNRDCREISKICSFLFWTIKGITHFGRIAHSTNHTYLQQYRAQWKSHTERMTGIRRPETNYILQSTRNEITGKTSKTLVWDCNGQLRPKRDTMKKISWAALWKIEVRFPEGKKFSSPQMLHWPSLVSNSAGVQPWHFHSLPSSAEVK